MLLYTILKVFSETWALSQLLYNIIKLVYLIVVKFSNSSRNMSSLFMSNLSTIPIPFHWSQDSKLTF